MTFLVEKHGGGEEERKKCAQNGLDEGEMTKKDLRGVRNP